MTRRHQSARLRTPQRGPRSTLRDSTKPDQREHHSGEGRTETESTLPLPIAQVESTVFGASQLLSTHGTEGTAQRKRLGTPEPREFARPGSQPCASRGTSGRLEFSWGSWPAGGRRVFPWLSRSFARPSCLRAFVPSCNRGRSCARDANKSKFGFRCDLVVSSQGSVSDRKPISRRPRTQTLRLRTKWPPASRRRCTGQWIGAQVRSRPDPLSWLCGLLYPGPPRVSCKQGHRRL